MALHVEAVELRRVGLPLVAPFRTSFGTQTDRDALLLRIIAVEGEGWGECVALSDPLYSSEYVDGAHALIRDHLLPRLFAANEVDGAAVASLLGGIKGHHMAKAAVELAVLDAELKATDLSLANFLGPHRELVDCGVSVGIVQPIARLLEAVAAYLDEGYRRIKLKIEPGWDVEPVRAVRERFGADVRLQVDANAAYRIDDADHLVGLDPFGLLLIEQPLAEDDLVGHAELASRIKTPICLDESITSLAATSLALALGACTIVNIKPGRVGGVLEARRIHDLCLARGVAVWCGGMLETGIGRAANVALAALPGFTLPGDTSASHRYFRQDITPPFELEDGRLRVPTGAGIGVPVLDDELDRVTLSVDTVWASR